MLAGTLLVRTAQPLGALAVYLLEPGSEDGLATWNFFDSELKEGGDFPVVRLPPAGADLAHERPNRLPETIGEPPRPITFDSGRRRRRPQATAVAAGSVAALRWLDGEHWLQVRDGPAA